MEKNVLSEVHRTIGQERLFTPSQRIVVAISGGADSVALLNILISLGYTCEAAHCNFHLRGEESMRDEQFVRQLCEQKRIPLHVKDFDTAGYARSKGISIEMAARELRYDYFHALLPVIHAQVIAVAHHQDDNVETLLLNLLRGTGLQGLTGMKWKNGVVVRPLLGLSRASIVDYLQEIKQPYITDSSNLVPDVVRNRIRLQLLPLMQEIAPAAIKSISTTQQNLMQAKLLYDSAVEAAKQRVTQGDRIIIDALLQQSSPGTVLFEILHPCGFNTAQIQDVFNQLGGEPGKVYSSPTHRLLRDRGCLILRTQDRQVAAFEVTVPLQGEVMIPGSNHMLTIGRTPIDSMFSIPREPHTACLDVDKLGYPLTLRTLNTADRFTPFGMKGERLLSDFLTDSKLSVFEKEEQVVLCSAGRIAWVVGRRIDAHFALDAGSKHALIIKWQQR